MKKLNINVRRDENGIFTVISIDYPFLTCSDSLDGAIDKLQMLIENYAIWY
jgi:hypothetical protein